MKPPDSERMFFYDRLHVVALNTSQKIQLKSRPPKGVPAGLPCTYEPVQYFEGVTSMYEAIKRMDCRKLIFLKNKWPNRGSAIYTRKII
jgi:hypothetical protein